MSGGAGGRQGPKGRAPHPATVVQAKVPHPATVARGEGRAPHPATVAQAKVPPGLPRALPPHPSLAPPARETPSDTVAQRWEGPRHGDAIQRMKRAPSKYREFLNQVCGTIEWVLVINNDVDGDCESLAETSMGFYASQDLGVAKRTLCWKAESRTLEGNTQLLFNLKKKRVLVVVTSHGNVHWLFGDVPDNEDAAAQAFGVELGSLEQKLTCTFVGVVLDACMSATEVFGDQAAIQVSCPARTLSGFIGVPVLAFNGKASSGTVAYYDKDKERRLKTYANGCLIFGKGQLLNDPGNEEIWHSGEYLQNQGYYGQLFVSRPGADGYFRSK